jgi:hypothetical protein
MYFVFIEVFNLWGLRQKSTYGFSHLCFPLLDFFNHVIYFWMLAWVGLIDAYCNMRAILSLEMAYGIPLIVYAQNNGHQMAQLCQDDHKTPQLSKLEHKFAN